MSEESSNKEIERLKLELDAYKILYNKSDRDKYNCCKGSVDCAVNKTNKRIDRLLGLALTDPLQFKEDLWVYMETIETDRDWWKAKAKGEIE